jgi:hypothetical protein
MDSSNTVADAEHDDGDGLEQEDENAANMASPPQPTQQPAVNGCTVENRNKTTPVDRKPEDELFVLVDDDLDNDIISMHAAAFRRVDPFSDMASESVAAKPQEAPMSVQSVASTEALEHKKAEMSESTEAAGTESGTLSADGNGDPAMELPPTDNVKISEKPTAKRLVCMMKSTDLSAAGDEILVNNGGVACHLFDTCSAKPGLWKLLDGQLRFAVLLQFGRSTYVSLLLFVYYILNRHWSWMAYDGRLCKSSYCQVVFRLKSGNIIIICAL